MFRRILVPLDGSARAEKAIPVAARIARHCNATLVFVEVVLPPVEFGTYSPDRTVPLKPSAFDRREGTAQSYLESVISNYEEDLDGIGVKLELLVGAASHEVYETIRLEAIDLIVLCSHGETGLKRWVYGSVAQELMRHSSVPILVFNEHGLVPSMPNTVHTLSVLVPVDGSPLSETALLPAAQVVSALSAPFKSQLRIFFVVDLPSVYGRLKDYVHITDIVQEDIVQQAREEAEQYVERLVKRCETEFAGLNVSVTSSIEVSQEIARTIVHEAERTRDGEGSPTYDMIAMATHGRSGLSRLFMGSVTEHVHDTTKLPMLIVRPLQKEGVKETVSESKPSEVKEVGFAS
jgi:nucleotide-binding universal stress UspA family protein